MKNKSLALVILLIGVLGGFFVSKCTPDLTMDLRVPSATFIGKDSDVAFANSLGLAKFSGAWVQFSGEKMINSVNSVSIDCWLVNKTCNVAQANIVDGLFYNDIDYYDLIEWTNSGQITAISSSACEDQILKADIKTKVVTLSETRKEDADNSICSQDRKPIVLKLGSIGYK